jgi:hypothetical protein
MASYPEIDPFSQPRQFQDNIIKEMQEAFTQRADNLKADVMAKIDAKLAEVDAVLENRASASAQDVRMACLHLVFGNGAAYTFVSEDDPAKRAEALVQYVLNGAKPEAA